MNIMRKAGASPAIALWLISLPVGAAAQTSNSAQVTGGPMVVERVKSGVLVAPDFAMTDFDGKAAGLFGVYGGWLNDESLLIGAGAYWLGDTSNNSDMWYFGLVTGWFTRMNRPVGFGVKGLVGFGEATLVNQVPFVPRLRGQPLYPAPGWAYARYRDDFFVFDPNASVLVRLNKSMKLAGSVGYRLTAGAWGPDDRLHGVTGSVSLQIGSGF